MGKNYKKSCLNPFYAHKKVITASVRKLTDDLILKIDKIINDNKNMILFLKPKVNI